MSDVANEKWRADLPTQNTIFNRVMNQTIKRQRITIFVAIQTTKQLLTHLGIDNNLNNNLKYCIPNFTISRTLQKSFFTSVKKLLRKKVLSGVSLLIRSPETEIRRRIFSELAYVLSDNYYASLLSEYIQYTHKHFPQPLAFLLILAFKKNIITAYFSASNQNGHFQWLIQASSIVNSQPSRCKTHCKKFQRVFNEFGSQYDFIERTMQIKAMLGSIKRRSKIKKLLDNLNTNMKSKKKTSTRVVVRNPTTIVSIIYGELQLLTKNDFNNGLKQYMITSNIYFVGNDGNGDGDDLFDEAFGCTYNNDEEKRVVFMETFDNSNTNSNTTSNVSVVSVNNTCYKPTMNMSDDDSDDQSFHSDYHSLHICDNSQPFVVQPIIVHSHQNMHVQRTEFSKMEWSPVHGSKALKEISDMSPFPTPPYTSSTVESMNRRCSNEPPFTDYNMPFGVSNVSNVSHHAYKNRHGRKRSSLIGIPKDNKLLYEYRSMSSSAVVQLENVNQQMMPSQNTTVDDMFRISNGSMCVNDIPHACHACCHQSSTNVDMNMDMDMDIVDVDMNMNININSNSNINNNSNSNINNNSNSNNNNPRFNTECMPTVTNVDNIFDISHLPPIPMHIPISVSLPTTVPTTPPTIYPTINSNTYCNTMGNNTMNTRQQPLLPPPQYFSNNSTSAIVHFSGYSMSQSRVPRNPNLSMVLPRPQMGNSGRSGRSGMSGSSNHNQSGSGYGYGYGYGGRNNNSNSNFMNNVYYNGNNNNGSGNCNANARYNGYFNHF